MGLRSRNKGKRAEYDLRDHLRSLGFKDAQRVPLSGASAGYKGDVMFTVDDREVLGEIKARKDEFGSIYALLDTHCKGLASIIGIDGHSAIISYSFHDLGFCVRNSVIEHRVYSDLPKEYAKAGKKLINAKKWVQQSHFLILKNDRKPFLFIRYLF